MKTTQKGILRAAAAAASALPLFVFAQGGITPVPIAGEGTNIYQILVTVMSWAFGLLLVLAAAFIFFAGFTYLTAAGNEDALKRAKNYILYAVVAIVIAFLAQAIIGVVKSLLGVGR